MIKLLHGKKKRKLFRPVKLSPLILTLLLALVFFCSFAALVPQKHSDCSSNDSGGNNSSAGYSSISAGGNSLLRGSSNHNNIKSYYDIAAFKKARMKFPEKHAPACPGECRLVHSREFDLDGDGFPEKYTLRNGRVTVHSGSRIIWQSSDEWWVDYFFLGDINNDGTPELCLLLWKEGSFGPYKPFWLDENDPSVKNHLFIYKLKDGDFKPVWQSSNLDCPNYQAALIDPESNGENILAVTEGSYTDPQKKETTLWKWNGWGFTRID